MSAKKIIQDFYKSDALINSDIMDTFLHPEFVLEWNSSKGLIVLNKKELLNLTNEMSRAYVRSKIRIKHILQDKNLVSVQYSHAVKTIENPREEMLLAHFFAIWEVKDDKLYRSYQMSQLA